MKKCAVEIYEHRRDGTKKHYKSINLPYHAKDVWGALAHGAGALLGIDLDELRSRRKRKGGRKKQR